MEQTGVIVYSSQSAKYMPQSPESPTSSLASSSPIRKPDNCQVGNNNLVYYPWLWSEGAQQIQLSPPTPSDTHSDDQMTTPQMTHHRSSALINGRSIKRGRPKLESITGLMNEGTSSPSAIKCNICNRVFPREKSLQAHVRTHTGML